jgi:hypothetical protein
MWRRLEIAEFTTVNFSPSSRTSSLFGPNILLGILFSTVFNARSSLKAGGPVHIHTKQD